MARSKQAQAGSEEEQLELTPMIDIVFNLLIFFMCATTFRTEEGVLQAFLPRDRGPGVVRSAHEVAEARVRLLCVRPDGSAAAAGERGAVVVALGARRLNAPGELEAAGPASPVWRALHDGLQALAAADRAARPNGLPVIIDAKPMVPTQHVVSALNEVVRLGLTDVTFAAPEVPLD